MHSADLPAFFLQPQDASVSLKSRFVRPHLHFLQEVESLREWLAGMSLTSAHNISDPTCREAANAAKSCENSRIRAGWGVGVASAAPALLLLDWLE